MIKRYLPKSLFGRALMILVLPVVLLQAVLALDFIRRHYDGVSSQMAAGVARELNYAVSVVEGAEDVETARARLRQLSAPLGTEFRLAEDAQIPREALRRFYDITGGAVEETLKADVRRPITLDLLSSDRYIGAEILTDKGVVQVQIDRRRMIASNPHQLLVITGATSILLVTVAVLFLRNQVRPIRQLAAAADALGRGIALPFEPSGAEEVRRAGGAFLAMRDRIERHVEQRTRMLSGVSHDLRTPLTRMKLALGMLDEGPEIEGLQRDVREMEHMIDTFLAFARGEAAEANEVCDPAALARDVAARASRVGVPVRVWQRGGESLPPVALRRSAIERAIGNLVGNAQAFGRTVRLGVERDGLTVCFIVEDDGPGIPEADRAAALRPFVRLDTARNQDRGGGTGLGLAIAADIAHAHGGSLELGESEELGGLRAVLCVPERDPAWDSGETMSFKAL